MRTLILLCVSILACFDVGKCSLFFLIRDDLVSNCSCSGVDSCQDNKFTAERCTCHSKSKSELAREADTAQLQGKVFWTNAIEPIAVCCSNASSDNAKSIFGLLLDYTFIKDLALNDCQDLHADASLTVYGLQNLTVKSTRGRHREQGVDMAKTDLTKTTGEYKDQHLVMLHRNVVRGTSEIKSWSLLLKSNDTKMPENPLETALVRAPRQLKARRDKNFMFTFVYL